MKNKKPRPTPHHRADRTRHRIIKAARKLFVKYGFAATSTIKIAQLANVQHSLIFHHFSTKQTLWIEVKQAIVAESKKKHPVLPSTELPFKVFLRKLLTQSIQFYRDNPDIVAMISWQRLEHRKQPHIGLTLSANATQWLQAIQHYQQQGDIDHGFKPEFIITLLLSITSNAGMDQNVFINDNTELSAYIDFCGTQLHKILTPSS